MDLLRTTIAAAAVGMFLLFPAPPSIATAGDEIAAPTDHGGCKAASDGTTAATAACLKREYDRLDAELNATYRAVRKQLGTAKLRNRLVESQRVWIWRRDDICDRKREQSRAALGEAADVIHAECRINMVADRIAWLRKVPANPGYLDKV